MTFRSRFPAAGVIAAALVALVVLAGCGDDDDDQAATSTTADATTSTTAEPTSTTTRAQAEAAVIAAYQAGWDAITTASNPPNPDHPVLVQRLVDQALEIAQDRMRQYGAEGTGLRGTFVVENVQVTELTSTRAVVQNCLRDQTEIYRLATGEVVTPASNELGADRGDLKFVDGAWKVSNFSEGSLTCA
ncbi:MAG: hypothetical protein ACRD0U_11700 [Acidimicrobiales bacterium]